MICYSTALRNAKCASRSLKLKTNPTERQESSETFQRFQGEGFLTGVESTFVRCSGCNLRCWYCDTPYASWSAEGEDLAVEEIVESVQPLVPIRHVTATLGEVIAVPPSQDSTRRAARPRRVGIRARHPSYTAAGGSNSSTRPRPSDAIQPT